jgi:hypothetical protein
MLEGSGGSSLAAAGVVTAVADADLASSACWGAPEHIAIGSGRGPVVEVGVDDLVLGQVHVAMRVPGFTVGSLMAGDAVEITASTYYQGGETDGADFTRVVVTSNGAFVAGAALNEVISGIDTGPGAHECSDADVGCALTRHALEVSVGGDTASIATDETAEVGGLAVTNDHVEGVERVGDELCPAGALQFGAAAP